MVLCSAAFPDIWGCFPASVPSTLPAAAPITAPAAAAPAVPIYEPKSGSESFSVPNASGTGSVETGWSEDPILSVEAVTGGPAVVSHLLEEGTPAAVFLARSLT